MRGMEGCDKRVNEYDNITLPNRLHVFNMTLVELPTVGSENSQSQDLPNTSVWDIVDCTEQRS